MTLESFWLEYKNVVMEPDAPQVQYDECKAAFYGGFLQCLAILSELPDTVSEDEAVKLFTAWRKETENWMEKLSGRKP